MVGDGDAMGAEVEGLAVLVAPVLSSCFNATDVAVVEGDDLDATDLVEAGCVAFAASAAALASSS